MKVDELYVTESNLSMVFRMSSLALALAESGSQTGLSTVASVKVWAKMDATERAALLSPFATAWKEHKLCSRQEMYSAKIF